MDAKHESHITLSVAASSVIWKAFGVGECHSNSLSTLEMIGRLTREHVAPDDQNATIATIRDCFETQGEHRWLKTEMRAPIAVHILDGVRRHLQSQDSQKDADAVFWAVGSVEPTLAARIIDATWDENETNALSEIAFDVLERLVANDEVIDARRMTRIEGGKIRATVAEIPREGRINTFRRLRGEYFDLYLGVANAVRLLVALNPEYFCRLVNNIDHPYLKVLAADEMTDQGAANGKATPVDWITGSASGDMVRLAIVHTLESINEADSKARRESGSSSMVDDRDAATDDMIQDLVERLNLLGPARSASMIFELLNDARNSLNSYGRATAPLRYQQLSKRCGDLLAQLTTDNWSDELFDALHAGLMLNDLSPLTMPLAELAWELEEENSERASRIFRAILDLLDQKVERSINDRHGLYTSLTRWQQRECVLGFGVALAASGGDLELTDWVAGKCQALPLSRWDAEEDHELFLVADDAAQLIFLVAFHAIDVANSNSIPINSRKVRSLAELHWLHCRFAGSGSGKGLDEMHPAEFSARVAAVYGEPSETWLLNQARDPKVHLRTLWALFDQRIAVVQSRDPGREFAKKLAGAIVQRYPDDEKLSLFDLHYLGKLWLLLGVRSRAWETAMAISAYQPTRVDRPHKILSLTLLVTAANNGRNDEETKARIIRLYGELWPTKFTEHHELDDRRVIDDYLGGT